MRLLPTTLRSRATTSRLVIFGESLGTAVAIALAAERTVGAVILDAPFTSIVDVGAAAYPFAPVRLLTRISSIRTPASARQGAAFGFAWR